MQFSSISGLLIYNPLLKILFIQMLELPDGSIAIVSSYEVYTTIYVGVN